MSGAAGLLRMHWRRVRNRVFGGRRRLIGALGVLGLFAGAQVGVFLGLRWALLEVGDLLGRETVAVFAGSAVIWVALMGLLAGFRQVVAKLWQSPDTALLLAMPLRGAELTAYRMLLLVGQSLRDGSLVLVPYLLAVGAALSARAAYYPLAIAVYLLLTATVVSLGAAAGTALAAWLSPRTFVRLAAGLQGIAGASFIYLAVTGKGLGGPFGLISLLGSSGPVRWLSGGIGSPVAAARATILAGLSPGGRLEPAAVATLVLGPCIAFAVACLVGQRFLEPGWHKMSPPVRQLSGRGRGPGATTEARTRPSLSLWMFEWRAARRNRMMLPPALMSLGLYAVAVAALSSRWAAAWPEPLVLGAAAAAAAFLVGAAAAIPFLSAEAAVNPGVMQGRFWLAKAMPIDGRSLFWSRTLMVASVAAALVLPGPVVIGVTRGSAPLTIIAAGLWTAAVTVGHVALNTATELAVLGPWADRRTLANLIGLAASVAYLAGAVGPVALGLGNTAPGLRWGPGLWAPMVMTSLAVVAATLWLSGRIGAAAWDELEL